MLSSDPVCFYIALCHSDGVENHPIQRRFTHNYFNVLYCVIQTCITTVVAYLARMIQICFDSYLNKSASESFIIHCTSSSNYICILSVCVPEWERVGVCQGDYCHHLSWERVGVCQGDYCHHLSCERVGVCQGDYCHHLSWERVSVCQSGYQYAYIGYIIFNIIIIYT